MSWLFGYSTKPPQLPTDDASAGGSGSAPPPPPPNLSKAEKKAMEAYRFDSSALERAAQAARELERSRHAKDALELSKLQEATRQQEHLAKVKEYEAAIEQTKLDQRRVDYEERRKTLQEETKQHQLRAQYQDQLAKKRYDEQIITQQKSQEEILRKQEESVAKQEAMRRATLEHEMELREKNKLKAIEASAKAQAAAARSNRDLTLEQIRVRAAEQRTTVLEGLRTAGALLGSGARALAEDWQRAAALAGGATLLALGVYGARGAAGVAARFLEARLARPRLVQETSRFSLLQALRHPVRTVRAAAQRLRTRGSGSGDALAGVVLAPPLESQVRDVALAAHYSLLNGGPQRNLLVYGPPGTGKTLFCRRLAQHSGMEYAILSGGDVAGLGPEAVPALHRVFDWARASRRGLVLFIDEADAFLRKRTGEPLSGDLRSALNAFLYLTSEQSSRLLLVFASNLPNQLEKAVSNRVDKILYFSLPGEEERERLLALYLDHYVLAPAARGFARLKVERFDYGAMCHELAAQTEGLSGRELSKLAVTWQAKALAGRGATLTRAMCVQLTHEFMQEHRQKLRWMSAEERSLEEFDAREPRRQRRLRRARPSEVTSV